MQPAVRHCATHVSWLLISVMCMSSALAQPTRLPQLDNRLCSEAVRSAIASTVDSVRGRSAADVATAAAFMAKIDGQRALCQDTHVQVQMLTSGFDDLLTQIRLQSNRSAQDIAAATERISTSIQQPLQKLTAATSNISNSIERLPESFRISQQSESNTIQVQANLTAQIRGYCESVHNTGACARADRLPSLSNESLTLLRGLPAILQSVIRESTTDSRAHLSRVLENVTFGTPSCCNGALNQSLFNAIALLMENQTTSILKNQTVSIASLLKLASTHGNSSSRTADLSTRIALQSDQLSQKVEQMLALLVNMSGASSTSVEWQSSYETHAVSTSEVQPTEFNKTGANQSFVHAILQDIDTRLSMKLSPSRGLTRNDSVSYLMPKKLTYYDIVIKYTINMLQAIDRKMEQANKANLSYQSSVEPPFAGYEDAKRIATDRASTVRPQERKTVAEIQAFSEYLSPAYSGFQSSLFYSGCQDAFTKGARAPGIYYFSVDGSPLFRAWCDFDGSGGWMVMQRRLDGSIDFFRRWTDYEKGFGNLWGEYWLGLAHIHQLTRRAAALSIYMEAFDGEFAWANYSTFRIGDVNSLYNLSVASYSGSAGDSLSYHNGQKFSAWDRDNDPHSTNCAHVYMGAWWYASCHGSNLNGRYERGNTASFATANCWQTFKGYNYGLKVTVMRIRA